MGLDVHQETIAVAVADTAGEVRYLGEIVSTPEAIAKLVGQIKRGTGRLAFCYEAGPCGYTIFRQLQELKQECQVVAPSLIPKKPGERVKTDRRDALSLARLHCVGELSLVWIPDHAQEALRDLTRACEDIKHLRHQAKQRLLSFLSRHGHRYAGRSRWTQAHCRWLERIKFARPEQ
ncbi:IS110 family transposase [Paraburkholderia humisilvae]|uniref:IS110 family transposase n=1 Tax=Paraburkholderia humisilvae TaxID=627669 RepID=UPI001FEC57E8|nr:transposase [Paraburkholderia humisilvae]